MPWRQRWEQRRSWSDSLYRLAVVLAAVSVRIVFFLLRSQ